jgi:hypothetical protein
LIDVGCTRDAYCLLDAAGELFCHGPEDFIALVPQGGAYDHLALVESVVGGNTGCVWTEPGAAECWLDTTQKGYAWGIDPPFVSLGLWFLGECLLLPDGSVECEQKPGVAFDLALPGPITSMGVGEQLCGIAPDGAVVCDGLYDDDGSYVGLPPPDRTFVSLSIGGSDGCGITTEGTMLCWADEPDDALQPP